MLRRRNSAAVLRTLHGAGAEADSSGASASLTVRQLAVACGISRPTAESIAESLRVRGWADEESPEPSGSKAGRPARRFRFRFDAGYILGIDIGTHSATALVADLAGTILSTQRTPVEPQVGAAVRLKAAGRVIRKALKAAGVPGSAVATASVATTGIVSSDGRVITAPPPGWNGLDLAAEIRSFVSAPVSVHNDIRLAALAERWRGAAQDVDDVLFALAGRTMGTALLLHGRPLGGFHDAAGELTRAEADRWRDAYAGFLEAQAGPRATEQSFDALGDPFGSAATSTTRGRGVVSELALALASAIEPLVCALDPEIVVIGGSLARTGGFAAATVQKYLEARCLFHPKVAVSTIGEDSVAVGAVRAALDDFEAMLLSEDFAADAPLART